MKPSWYILDDPKKTTEFQNGMECLQPLSFFSHSLSLKLRLGVWNGTKTRQPQWAEPIPGKVWSLKWKRYMCPSWYHNGPVSSTVCLQRSERTAAIEVKSERGADATLAIAGHRGPTGGEKTSAVKGRWGNTNLFAVAAVCSPEHLERLCLRPSGPAWWWLRWSSDLQQDREQNMSGTCTALLFIPAVTVLH